MIALVLLTALAGTPAPISIEHHGSLRDGLQEIARKGGLNLVATGSLNEEAVIHLENISPEEALTSVAEAYGLTLTHKGSLWVIKADAAPSSPFRTFAAPQPPIPPVPPMAPVPPMPPMPPVSSHNTKDDDDEGLSEADKARAHAEALRDQAEALREKAEELRRRISATAA